MISAAFHQLPNCDAWSDHHDTKMAKNDVSRFYVDINAVSCRVSLFAFILHWTIMFDIRDLSYEAAMFTRFYRLEENSVLLGSAVVR